MRLKQCVLYERECMNCRECEMCDLDPDKVCDNCCLCLDEADYNGALISGIILEDNGAPE